METTKRRAINEDPLQNKRRKNKNQVKMLEAELEANPHWTNEDMIKIAKKTGLSKSQVYKWNWDQKKKLNIMPSKVYVVQLPSELIDPKTGQIVLKSVEDMKKLKTLNIQHS
uniref:Homeobox domain-containing protein n=1 Tax=Euplotes harpa TaxID=151035 RepID=A0A7S3N806_9SPIT|mmetsp:Transcript_16514/g.19089  ORF Transcript_16514/g.19089 Transcript_16514/m.19089 type:complete len:112 (+) Transcript_16514:538-873(+)